MAKQAAAPAAAPAQEADNGPVLSPGDILGVIQRTALELNGYCMQDPRGISRDVVYSLLEKMAHFLSYFPAPPRQAQDGAAKAN